VRPESAQKPATESLRRRHVEIVVADLASQSVEKIARLVAGYDTIISAVAASTLLDQLTLVLEIRQRRRPPRAPPPTRNYARG
jgi:hypothetical protein